MAGQGAGQSDNVIEGLKKIFAQISNLKLAQDAQSHMQIIQGLEQIIMKYIQQQGQHAAQQAAGMAQQAAGGQPGGQPGMPPGQAQQIQPGGGAGMSGFGSPNPDELRRLLTQSPG